MKIAVIKTSALGDVLRTTVLLPPLKQLRKSVELTWITSSEAADLLRYNPYIDRLVCIDDTKDILWRADLFDWVISLDDDNESCQLAAALRTGLISGAYTTRDGKCHYTNDLRDWFGMGLLRPETEGGLEQANKLKKSNLLSYGTILYRCLNLPLPVARPQIIIPSVYRLSTQHWIAGTSLSENDLIIGLNTGASARWQYKQWGEEQTASLAIELADRYGFGVLIMGGARERERNDRILSQANRTKVVTIPSNCDLLTFAALVSHCHLLVTSDSLALHLAIACKIPVVTFFGPTSSEEIDLFERGHKVVTPLPCKCCYLTSCSLQPNCMDEIKVEQIVSSIISLLHKAYN